MCMTVSRHNGSDNKASNHLMSMFKLNQLNFNASIEEGEVSTYDGKNRDNLDGNKESKYS